MSDPTFRIIQNYKGENQYLVTGDDGVLTSYESYAFAMGCYQGIRSRMKLELDLPLYAAWKQWEEDQIYSKTYHENVKEITKTFTPKCDIDIYE